MDIIFVFIGGAFGALLRYSVLTMFRNYPADVVGVFMVNMLGCFIIGFVSYLAVKKNNILDENMKKLLSVGFCGGFTTFSAFTHPVLEMFLKHHYMYAVMNMFFSVIIGLVFVAWGMNCAYYFMAHLIRTGRFIYRQGNNG